MLRDAIVMDEEKEHGRVEQREDLRIAILEERVMLEANDEVY